MQVLRVCLVFALVFAVGYATRDSLLWFALGGLAAGLALRVVLSVRRARCKRRPGMPS